MSKFIDFYGLEFSGNDHPGFYSLILYSSGCNFRCFGCHNRLLAGWDYEDGSTKNINPKDFHKKISQDELNFSLQSNLVNLIVFCGGEFLINDLEKIESTISYIKEVNPSLKIRIDTNGSFPEKVESLISKKLIDGFAIDIKGPYWNEDYFGEIDKIIGIKGNKNLYSNICKSINMAKDLPLTIFRTVKYPNVNNESYFQEITNYVQQFNKPYFLNEFREV